MMKLRAGAGVVAAGLAALVVLAVRDSDPRPPADTTVATAAAPATSTSAPTTLSTVASTSSRPSPPSTTVAATPVPVITDAVVSAPACLDRAADASPPATVDPAALARFGPLGDSPSMVIPLPQGRPAGADELQDPMASVIRIPGGLLLFTRVGSGAEFDGTVLVALDQDGSVRWQRCGAGTPHAMAILASDQVLVPAYTDSTGAATSFDLLSLADGSPTGTLDDLLSARGLGRGDRTEAIWGTSSVVFTHGSDHVVDAGSDRMLVVDLATATAREIEYPAGSDGSTVFSLQLDVASSGMIVQRGDTWPALRAVLAPDGWSTADTDILAASPGNTDFGADGHLAEIPYLASVDALGNERWRREDLVARPHEGFTIAMSDGVVVGRGCHSGDQCDQDSVFFGLDAETGETLWEHDGAAAATVIGDGVMIVTEGGDSGWSMLDTKTGEPVASDQRWSDPSAFSQECCGGGGYIHVERLGGIVVAVNTTKVSVWYPKAVSRDTVSIRIP